MELFSQSIKITDLRLFTPIGFTLRFLLRKSVLLLVVLGGVFGDGTQLFAVSDGVEGGSGDDAVAGEVAESSPHANRVGRNKAVSVKRKESSLSVVISRPQDGSIFMEGEEILLEGSIGNSSSEESDAILLWSSSIDGPLENLNAQLSIGTHVLTAKATVDGAAQAFDSVTISIIANFEPYVNVNTVAQGRIYGLGDLVELSATAIDSEDGDLSQSISWSSSIDGEIEGVGPLITISNLSAGIHRITASALDSGNLVGSNSVAVNVQTPAGPFVSDDFTENDIDTNIWTFVDPVRDSSYVIEEGQLRISIPGGSDHDIWKAGNRVARMLQRIDDTDFGVNAKFGSIPSERFQNQGILIEQDTYNFIRYDFYSNGVELYVFAALFEDSSPTTLFNKSLGVSTSYHLKATRAGDRYTFEYSLDGVEWITGASFRCEFEVQQVGVYAGNASGSRSPAFTAVVDHVFNIQSPISPQDQGGPNGAPIVSIKGGKVATLGEAVGFEGSAFDPEDGELADSLVWNSDVDGPIGVNGSTLEVSSLSAGRHIITATATDSFGLEGSDEIALDVITPRRPLASDEFDGPSLNTDLWTFEDPKGDSKYALEGGAIRIDVPGGSDHDFWADGNRSSRIYQRVTDSDFSLEAGFSSKPRDQFQSQGIFVRYGEGDYIRFDIYSNNSAVYVFGATIFGEEASVLFNEKINISNASYLRLSRVEDQYAMEYSTDAKTWKKAGDAKISGEVERLGLYAGNASGVNSPPFTAVIDYLRLVAPKSNSDTKKKK